MENERKEYTVEYHTKPSPGSSFYRGSVTVRAFDSDEAESKAKRKLSQDACFHPSAIQVTRISEKR